MISFLKGPPFPGSLGCKFKAMGQGEGAQRGRIDVIYQNCMKEKRTDDGGNAGLLADLISCFGGGSFILTLCAPTHHRCG